MATLESIMKIIDTIAPFKMADAWDNSGLQVGSSEWDIRKIMIGLDVSVALMTAARDQSCDLVLTHHPLWLKPEKSINFDQISGSIIQMAANHKINIISAHTNLDKAINGLNDYFASKINMESTSVLHIESTPAENGSPPTGIGRIGALEKPMTLEHLARQIKKKLSLSYVKVTGQPAQNLTTAAICTGSGGSLVDIFLASNADVYITGDVKYHEARVVEQHGRAVIDVGHFGSEHMAIDLLSERLTQAFNADGINIEILKYNQETDPFIIV